MSLPHFRLKELLAAVYQAAGSHRRLHERLGGDPVVTLKSVRTWLRKSEEDLHRLHPAHVDAIHKAAADLHVEAQLFASLPPLWDFTQSFEDNLHRPIPSPPARRDFPNHRTPFLGAKLRSPFGASASVLTATSSRIHYLAAAGLDVLTYKTVRSSILLAHPTPNILACTSERSLDPDRPIPRIRLEDPTRETHYAKGTFNYFGMPSLAPEVWQADFRAAKAAVGPDQVLILSVVPTATRKDSDRTVVKDSVRVVELGLAAGATILELNLSCPNCSGREGDIYRDPQLAEEICKALSPSLRSAKLLLKIGYLEARQLQTLVINTAPYVAGFSLINTLAAKGDREGQAGPEPAFGGREAGLSGRPIFRYALRAVSALAEMRERERLADLVIIGMGGVTTPDDVRALLESGADIVQVTTVLFDDPLFGIRVQEALKSNLPRRLSWDDEREIARSNAVEAWHQLEGEHPGDRTALSAAFLEAWQLWDHEHAESAVLGPRRASRPPSIAEFKTRVLSCLRQVKS